MSGLRREQEVVFRCPSDCSSWEVEGRLNAEGRFEPVDEDDIVCVDCDARGDPVDDDVEVA